MTGSLSAYLPPCIQTNVIMNLVLCTGGFYNLDLHWQTDGQTGAQTDLSCFGFLNNIVSKLTSVQGK